MRHGKLVLTCFLLLAKQAAFSSSLFEEELSSCLKGGCFDTSQEHQEPLFRAFVSFSMPKTTWIEMSKGLERHGGAFVLRGLPNNSFQRFFEKVLEMRKGGVRAPITIDPEAFAEYGIRAVPTFVLETEKGYRKVVGNVTVDYALRKLKRKKL